MRRHSIGLAAIISVGVLTISACSTKKTDEADTAAAAAAAATATANVAAQPPKGALPPGWESKNSEELRAIADSVSWTTPTAGERTCANPKQCKKVQATISANSEARLITAQAAGTNGAMIARMELDGPYQTAMYKLRPGAFKYYVVVFSTGVGNAMGWKLVQVADNGKAPIQEIGQGSFVNCLHDPNPGAPAAADWRGCAGRIVQPASLQPNFKDSSGEGGGDQPGWVSCSEGCCTVSVAQIATAETLSRALASTGSSGKTKRGSANN